MGFRFYIQMGVSGLRFRLGIKVWDSFLRFKFGICFCAHVWDSGTRFLFGVQVLDTGLGLRFEVPVWTQARD